MTCKASKSEISVVCRDYLNKVLRKLHVNLIKKSSSGKVGHTTSLLLPKTNKVDFSREGSDNKTDNIPEKEEE